MRSCLAQLILILLCFAILAGSGVIWYLSQTAEFSRTDTQPGVLVKPRQVPIR
jgi:hypothetical protein